MRTEVVAGYDREKRREVEDLEDYPDEYPFVLIKVISEPTKGNGQRVASYIETGGPSERESRLFVERSPPSMEWLEKVFDLIRETRARGITSGSLHEIRINCENIEIQEEEPALTDQQKGRVYYSGGRERPESR
jgi:hypothetical protein